MQTKIGERGIGLHVLTRFGQFVRCYLRAYLTRWGPYVFITRGGTSVHIWTD